MFWLLTCVIMVAGLLPDLTIKAFDSFHLAFRTIYPGNEAMGTKKHGPKIIQTTYL